jgi:adenylate cyclase
MVQPEGLVSVLNRYLALAADALLKEEGTVEKFLGDAVMAWFNAPVLQPDHTLRAVRAAMTIHEEVDRLHKELHPDVRLKFGIGIHVGEAVLGLIGTEKRLDYTAIGDSVNTAKRIQENAAGGQVLISHAAYMMVKDRVVVGEAIPIQAKGKRDPIIVYEILEMK